MVDSNLPDLPDLVAETSAGNDLPDLPILTPQQQEEQARLAETYGNRPLEAAATGLASGATFGLSDVALQKAGVSPERLREVRQQNPIVSTGAEIVGAVAPALFSGGAGLIGTAARLTPAAQAARLGSAVAKGSKLGTGALAAGAAAGLGAATEGALYGAGRALSDDALERKELSAESLIDSVGSGALIGGAFGGAVGTAFAAAPKATNYIGSKVPQGLKNLGSTAKENIKEATKSFLDPFESSISLVANSSPAKLNLKSALAGKEDEFVDFLRNDVELNALSTPNTLFNKVTKIKQEAGETIGALSQQLDEVITAGNLPIRRSTAYQPLIDRTREFIAKAESVKGFKNEEANLAKKYLKDLVKLGSDETPFSFKQYDDVRKTLAKKAFGKDGQPLNNFKAELSEPLRRIARETIDTFANAADNLVPGIGSELKNANKLYHFSSLIDDSLERKAEKTFQVGLLDFVSAGLTGVPVQLSTRLLGNAARNATVLTDIGKKTQTVQEKIAKGVDSAFAAKEAVKKIPKPFNLAIISSGFALKGNEEQKKPKNKLEAFNNVKENITQLVADQNKLIELLAQKTARVNNASPTTGLVLQERLVTALNFLQQKMPKSSVSPGMFQRPYQPSSMELAKFERYLQVVDKPLSALEDLKNGTLTREHVEALQVVYPEIYKEIQTKVLDNIAKNPKLPYERKLQLGILLGIPADSSLQPQSVMQLQSNFAPAEGEETADNGLRVAGLDQLNTAGRTQTEVEQLESDVE